MEIPDDWRASKADARASSTARRRTSTPGTKSAVRKFFKLILLLLVAGLAWSAWAVGAFYDFRGGIRDADPPSLERRIDWASVRRSLREDLQAKLAAPGGSSDSRSAQTNRTIDALVSQPGIVNLLRTAKIDNRGWKPAAAANERGRVFDWSHIRYAFFSGSPLAFRVDISPDSATIKRPLILLFKWRGDWQLTRIYLPTDAPFDAAGAAQSLPPPAAPAPSQPQASVPGAERVVLYEEDPSDPNGKRYTGTVVWRTEQAPPATGGSSGLAVIAHVSIPDRPLSMTMAIRRNLDKSLPASHTIEVKFERSPSAAGGDIEDVAGIMMKPNDEAAGQGLAASRVKVSNNFFLVGLSAIELDLKHNMEILKAQPWFGIPFVYGNKSRALLAIEKGKTGDKTIAEALAKWNTTAAAGGGAAKNP
jgi:hypothetical protein